MPRLLGLLAVLIGAGLLWAAQRPLLDHADGSRRTLLPAGLAVLGPLAAALALAAATPDSGPRAEPISGFAHGRTALWGAAIETAGERPLEGSGAQSFFEASRSHQDPPPVRFAHNLPLESWAELGVAGALGVVLLYVASASLVVSARGSPLGAAAAWLLGPAVLAFLLTNLFDWPWHVPAAGAIFAIAVGGLAGSLREAPRASRSGRGPASASSPGPGPTAPPPPPGGVAH